MNRRFHAFFSTMTWAGSHTNMAYGSQRIPDFSLKRVRLTIHSHTNNHNASFGVLLLFSNSGLFSLLPPLERWAIKVAAGLVMGKTFGAVASFNKDIQERVPARVGSSENNKKT